ncbi:NACHT, LRR and PYD domains-containing protein 1b allele 3-like [Neolamprologus brichardi]|uniref:NACHT, LRR and PYD domains-containing protein 1b allele 3-like n=1 Tax=Neolamprologus brichardi TaxID=32507 RepID=UPI001643E9AE|nr:NACHT, LRR and PYD domains-containing protein 1b allele 3-like [Neolamprologus brichardi]
MADGEDFVDKHRSQLIQRVSNIAPILDELLDKKVIDQEQYDKIRALPTSQDKMRELYSGPLKASAACKKIFYESLLANEIFLIEDLSKERSPGEAWLLDIIVLEQFSEGLLEGTADLARCHRPANLEVAVALAEDHQAARGPGGKVSQSLPQGGGFSALSQPH